MVVAWGGGGCGVGSIVWSPLVLWWRRWIWWCCTCEELWWGWTWWCCTCEGGPLLPARPMLQAAAGTTTANKHGLENQDSSGIKYWYWYKSTMTLITMTLMASWLLLWITVDNNDNFDDLITVGRQCQSCYDRIKIELELNDDDNIADDLITVGRVVASQTGRAGPQVHRRPSVPSATRSFAQFSFLLFSSIV